jgi:hypothetical protein
MPAHAPASRASCTVRIVPATLGDDGPILGCAWLARQTLREPVPTRLSRDASSGLASAERKHLEAVEGRVFDVQRFRCMAVPEFARTCSSRVRHALPVVRQPGITAAYP